jgi:hypothetical protein
MNIIFVFGLDFGRLWCICYAPAGQPQSSFTNSFSNQVETIDLVLLYVIFDVRFLRMKFNKDNVGNMSPERTNLVENGSWRAANVPLLYHKVVT